MENKHQIIKVLNNLVLHYGHQDWWEDENWLKDAVSMILIQQSTQENVEKALRNLTEHFSLFALSEMPLEDLQMHIRPSGFFRQKALFIKNLVTFFNENGNGDLSHFETFTTDELRKKLLKIKGIGSETADSMLLYIFQRKVFIADTYAIRLFSRLGLGTYKTYEAMRKDFQPLTEEIPLKQCKEWHACIDTHGKYFRKNTYLDERFLFK
ncbi:MAG: endonuclease III domain-containing protein [Capnocytophaga sp.]|nr:endonuclease III domain-containing protein [Capnocytophaga sp.]